MKIDSGNIHQSKNFLAGISRASSDKFKAKFKMDPERPRSRGAVNQKRYRDKVREEHEENTKFRKFANERAPWLVAEIFAIENKVSNIVCKLRWLFSLHSLQHFVKILFIVSFFLVGHSYGGLRNAPLGGTSGM